MGMGISECNYTREINKRKCKCGTGIVRTMRHVTEESEYPPFEREYTDYFECDCPNQCEPKRFN